MDSDKYVMIGHSHILGDLVEIIHFNGGVLTKIVQNIPESRPNYLPSLRQRLERFQDAHYNPHAVNQFYPVSVQSLADFRPQEDEEYIIGFTGFKMLKLVQYLTKVFNFNFTPLIHPRASIAADVHILSGAIIQAGAIISSGVQIKEHTFINKGVKIGFGTKIERFASLAPGTIVGHGTWIKTGVILGIGSVILDGIVVNDYSIVAAGAVVIQDVPMNTLVAGIPAIIKKTNFYPTIEQ